MIEPRPPPIHPRDDDWPETRDYHREQAEEIARLREALRVALEALGPFSAWCDDMEDFAKGLSTDIRDDARVASAVTMGHARRARAAIAKIKEALAAARR